MPRKIPLIGLCVLAFLGAGRGEAGCPGAVVQADPTEIAGSRVWLDGPGGPFAYFAQPVAVYGHGVLGRRPEAAALVLGQGGCGAAGAYRIEAGAGHVFEDIAPRLVDLDGEALPELVVVRASVTQGAQLAVYGVREGALALLAATPPIGTRYRWLAPAAWEDLDGDGHVELAYVDRPHLARTLRVWRWRNNRLENVAAMTGVTNHAIGEETIRGFTRHCDRGPEMVLHSADESRLVGVTLRKDSLEARDLGPANRMEEVRTC